MICCTFFGHRDCPYTIQPILRSTLIDLIENHGVDLFYVGRQGAFDTIVYRVLQELAEKYTYGSTAQLLRQALSNHPSGRKP